MTADLLAALAFAARRHASQRRKGADQTPYVNHVIDVAHRLAQAGVADRETLLAAVLHDTVEDTGATPDEIAAMFGADVAALVGEVTDDTSLPKDERKRLQVAHAPTMSAAARRLKMADKASNVRDVGAHPPDGWPHERLVGYLDWAEAVVAGCRSASPALAAAFDAELAEARRRVGAEAASR